jgi:GntR family transcriptional regulator
VGIWFDIDMGSGVPIYVQLVEQVRRGVQTGGLVGGEKLPTVRALAGELGVAPNTVVRAYGELQREGVIESRPGVGTVVAGSVGETAREVRIEALHERLAVLVRDAVGLGVSEDDLWAHVDQEFERVAQRRAGGGPDAT